MREMDPSEIIEEYHNKKKQPRLCKHCGRSEMRNIGVRTSASVNYNVWKCQGCEKEDLELIGLSEDAKNVIGK